jgi:hypothetical protein
MQYPNPSPNSISDELTVAQRLQMRIRAALQSPIGRFQTHQVMLHKARECSSKTAASEWSWIIGIPLHDVPQIQSLNPYQKSVGRQVVIDHLGNNFFVEFAVTQTPTGQKVNVVVRLHMNITRDPQRWQRFKAGEDVPHEARPARAGGGAACDWEVPESPLSDETASSV